MKHITNSILFVTFIIVLNISFSVAESKDINDKNLKNWLLGEWILTYDPDNHPKDKILFRSDGTFTNTQIITGDTLVGKFLMRSNIIELLLIQDGKVISKIELTYDENMDKLYYRSEHTGNTSFYTKIDE